MTHNNIPALLNRDSKEAYAHTTYGWCEACGGYGPFSFTQVINSTLTKQWQLSASQRRAMSARESMYCVYCGCSYRLRLVARALNYWMESPTQSLLQNIGKDKFNHYKVAEINSCGVLHDILRLIPGLKYSEYGSTNPEVPSEDLSNLSYKDESLDIVLTSDVLEHVPDVKKALQETYRVLKPGGVHIMSIPLVMGRKTKQRTVLKGAKTSHLVDASFHGSGEPDYLVWTEFGDDFIQTVRECGFEAYHLFLNTSNQDDMSGIILAMRPKSKSKMSLPKQDHINDEVIDVAWQAKRIESLITKLNLTKDHAANLEDIIIAYRQEIEKLKEAIAVQRQELETLRNSHIIRITRGIRRLFRH